MKTIEYLIEHENGSREILVIQGTLRTRPCPPSAEPASPPNQHWERRDFGKIVAQLVDDYPKPEPLVLVKP